MKLNEVASQAQTLEKIFASGASITGSLATIVASWVSIKKSQSELKVLKEQRKSLQKNTEEADSVAISEGQGSPLYLPPISAMEIARMNNLFLAQHNLLLGRAMRIF